jgi:MFS family permease
MPRAFRPFAIRDYRVLATALAISVFGHGLWAVAMVYQVKALGGGPVQLSVVATATSVGILAFVLLGGIVADRVPGRRILILVEAATLVTVATVATLALSGWLQLWQLAVAGFLLGSGAAFFFPAYSALLPRILPDEMLLAANGVEGTMRPVLQQAAGPAAAGALVAALSPGHAIAIMAACHLLATWVLTTLSREAAGGGAGDEVAPDLASPAHAAPAAPDVAAPDAAAAAPPSARATLAGILTDLREGVAYTARTPWLKWTLLFAVVWVFLFIGPIEVLLPFAVADQLGGDARTFGFILAFFGAGGAIGSFATASVRLPRRYLTLMIAAWAIGGMPLAAVGYLGAFWQMALVMFVVGLTGGMGQVLWGTMLQRRVPRHMLGRVSSLDFFVSLLLMPVSMAAAGPLGALVPIGVVFLVAGLASPVIGLVAWLAAGMARDEIANPLREPAIPAA